jgi:tRNA pseudouridine55 synthase
MNGWLNINKPLNFSSAKVVAIVKRKLGAKKVGHGGTLDPLATGVLPICINNATKESEKIMNFRKEYLFNIKFGEIRTTNDGEGDVVEKNNIIPNEKDIILNIPLFIGIIEQTPPLYSAIKVNGKRAYQLAREGKQFELKGRQVAVYDLKFIKWKNLQEIQLLVECGKGFYVRSFAVDFAKKLGVLGYVSQLERVSVGIFNRTNMIEIDEIDENVKLINL